MRCIGIWRRQKGNEERFIKDYMWACHVRAYFILSYLRMRILNNYLESVILSSMETEHLKG